MGADEVECQRADFQTKSDELQAKADVLRTKSDEFECQRADFQTKSDELQAKADELQSKSDEFECQRAEFQTKSDISCIWKLQTWKHQLKAKADELQAKSDEFTRQHDADTANAMFVYGFAKSAQIKLEQMGKTVIRLKEQLASPHSRRCEMRCAA